MNTNLRTDGARRPVGDTDGDVGQGGPTMADILESIPATTWRVIQAIDMRSSASGPTPRISFYTRDGRPVVIAGNHQGECLLVIVPKRHIEDPPLVYPDVPLYGLSGLLVELLGEGA